MGQDSRKKDEQSEYSNLTQLVAANLRVKKKWKFQTKEKRMKF